METHDAPPGEAPDVSVICPMYNEAAGIEAVKKYFISNSPRGVAMYLLAVTRDTVDSCI